MHRVGSSIDSDQLKLILALRAHFVRPDSVDSSLRSSPLRGALGVQIGNADLSRIGLPLVTKHSKAPDGAFRVLSLRIKASLDRIENVGTVCTGLRVDSAIPFQCALYLPEIMQRG